MERLPYNQKREQPPYLVIMHFLKTEACVNMTSKYLDTYQTALSLRGTQRQKDALKMIRSQIDLLKK